MEDIKVEAINNGEGKVQTEIEVNVKAQIQGSARGSCNNGTMAKGRRN